MTNRLDQLQKLHAADPTDADITYMIAMEHAKADDATGGASGDDSGGASGGASGATSGGGIIDWLDKTLDLDPNYLYAYFQKAKAQSALGNDTDAQATLQLGIEKANAAGDAKAVSELTELMASMG